MRIKEVHDFGIFREYVDNTIVIYRTTAGEMSPDAIDHLVELVEADVHDSHDYKPHALVFDLAYDGLNATSQLKSGLQMIAESVSEGHPLSIVIIAETRSLRSLEAAAVEAFNEVQGQTIEYYLATRESEAMHWLHTQFDQ